MASDELRIPITADASGVSDGVKDAERALGKLENTVDESGKSLNRYGEKLGKALGPGDGLHGRLDNLESPLRDTEGAIARSQMAVIEFGNSGATAADKVGAGFLLAGDAIAAFTSGGVVGVGIAAAVAGFSIINQLMTEEAEKAKEAEEAQKKHAEQLANVGKSAVDAGISIAALQAKEAAGIALASVRAVEQDKLDQMLRKKRIKDRIEDLNAELRASNEASEMFRINRQLKEEAAALKSQETIVKNLDGALYYARLTAKETQAGYLNDLKLSEESATTAFITGLKKSTEAKTEAIKKINEDVKASTAEATKESKKQIFDEAAFERQVRQDNAAFDLQTAQQLAEAELGIRFAASQEQAAIDLQLHNKRRQQAEQTADFQRRLANDGTELAKSAALQVTSALFEQAKAGELSAEKVLEAVLSQTGQTLVAKGTLYAFEGVATLNPVMAGTGAAMIASGVAMGGASGAISRAGQPAATPASTPTDTRQSRAASSGTGGEGGTTVIQFNGPAYDRRGISTVLNSGLKMAKHRRVMGS